MTFYYAEPTQVFYLNWKAEDRAGLAFHEYVVDLETGEGIRTSSILDCARWNGIEPDAAIKEQKWKSLK